MTGSDDKAAPASRRGFLKGAGVALAATGFAGAAAPAEAAAPHATAPTEPFFGAHQAGIVTPAQMHTYIIAFDMISTKQSDLVEMLKRWTVASARMSSGLSAVDISTDTSGPGADTADALDLPPSRLTITYGFGASLFTKDGQDRFGLAAMRPEAFVDLPKFPGDQMVAAHTNGDIVVQACADDPQVAFHALRQLARLSYDVAEIRWVQAGFIGNFGTAKTPRNLMGFRDGTGNPKVTDKAAMDEVVWVGNEGPAWMRGGSYVVIRRTRIAIEHWDRMNVAFQEQTVGRHKYSGAPLGLKHENDTANLDAVDADGNPVIPENSHLRLSTAASNEGSRILRRSYSYNDGVNFTAERWPPWRQAMEYDAGLVFICYQRDPTNGFIKIFEKLSRFDMLNQFVTPVGGGMFACPGGVKPGEFIAQRMFESA